MTQQLTIPTPFADLAELTENFAQRVDEQRLMLPHFEAMPDGEWLQFTVALADGTPALMGVGRVQGSFDNGEEHPPEYRFDVVLDSLQFEGMQEVMFERLLVARESQLSGDPVTGEVSVEELEKHEAARAARPVEPQDEVADDAGWGDADAGASEAMSAEAGEDAEPMEAEAALEAAPEADAPEAAPEDVGTGEVDVDELEETATPAPVVSAPAARAKAVQAPVAAYPTHAREPGKLPSPHTFGAQALTRPSLLAVWSPEPAERPDGAQSSGLFDYQGGVPRPARPPRPELDASQRVQAAPRPGAPWPRRGTGQHVVVQAESPEADAGFEDLGMDSGVEHVGADAPSGGDETSQYEVPAGEAEQEEW